MGGCLAKLEMEQESMDTTDQAMAIPNERQRRTRTRTMIWEDTERMVCNKPYDSVKHKFQFRYRELNPVYHLLACAEGDVDACVRALRSSIDDGVKPPEYAYELAVLRKRESTS